MNSKEETLAIGGGRELGCGGLRLAGIANMMSGPIVVGLIAIKKPRC
jgi:hypothetical protein